MKHLTFKIGCVQRDWVSWLLGSPLVNLTFLSHDQTLDCGGVNRQLVPLCEFTTNLILNLDTKVQILAFNMLSQVLLKALLVWDKVQDARKKREHLNNLEGRTNTEK